MNQEISNFNMRREKEYKGKTLICGKCNRSGVVGCDLVSVFTISSHFGSGAWWVHPNCYKGVDKSKIPDS